MGHARGKATHLTELLQFDEMRSMHFERGLGAVSFGLSVQTRDDVAHRCRELAFRIGPLTRTADMLVADDADDLAALKDRRVEHRCDPERRQIRRTEFL